jgi:hypothetical protein
MAVSSMLSWILTGVAGSAGTTMVGALRTANFIAGGTAHTVRAGRIRFPCAKALPFGSGVRRLAWVAVVPAVASLLSLVVFQASALMNCGFGRSSGAGNPRWEYRRAQGN